MSRESRSPAHNPEVTIIGAGKFGSAIAEILSRDNTPTTLVTRSHSRLAQIRERMSAHSRDSLSVQSFEKTELGDHVMIALPSADFPLIVSQLALRHHENPNRTYTALSKGLTAPDGETPLELLTRTFDSDNCAVASGPSLAVEMNKQSTRLLVASTGEQTRTDVADLLASDTTQCHLSTDPHGIEYAGIAKNIATLGFYACREATRSLNTAGAYASDLFAEVYQFAAQEHDIDPRSFLGAGGVGDLLTTSHATSSRNTQAGKLLGNKAAHSASEVEKRIKQAVESIHTTPLLKRRMDHADMDAPATTSLSQRIVGDISHEKWITHLSES